MNADTLTQIFSTSARRSTRLLAQYRPDLTPAQRDHIAAELRSDAALFTALDVAEQYYPRPVIVDVGQIARAAPTLEAVVSHHKDRTPTDLFNALSAAGWRRNDVDAIHSSLIVHTFNIVLPRSLTAQRLDWTLATACDHIRNHMPLDAHLNHSPRT